MHKVVLSGFNRFGQIFCTRPYIFTETFKVIDSKPILKDTLSELNQIIVKNNEDFLTLVRVYKTAKNKYYPEKDMFLKLNKGDK